MHPEEIGLLIVTLLLSRFDEEIYPKNPWFPQDADCAITVPAFFTFCIIAFRKWAVPTSWSSWPSTGWRKHCHWLLPHYYPSCLYLYLELCHRKKSAPTIQRWIIAVLFPLTGQGVKIKGSYCSPQNCSFWEKISFWCSAAYLSYSDLDELMS